MVGTTLGLLVVGIFGCYHTRVKNDFSDYAPADSYAKRSIKMLFEEFGHIGRASQIVTGRIEYSQGTFEKIEKV